MQKDLKDREDRIISREQSLKAEQKRYDGLLREVGEKRQKLEERLVQLRQERLTKEAEDNARKAEQGDRRNFAVIEPMELASK